MTPRDSLSYSFWDYYIYDLSVFIGVIPHNASNMRTILTEVGGGSKQKFRWVDNLRIPKDWPEDKELVEKVIGIHYDPIRTSCLAMTGYGEKLRWQIATTNMKVGDLIRSTTEIPGITVKPLEGNSHPLGNENFSL